VLPATCAAPLAHLPDFSHLPFHSDNSYNGAVGSRLDALAVAVYIAITRHHNAKARPWSDGAACSVLNGKDGNRGVCSCASRGVVAIFAEHAFL
jgi:hypothetical protein